MLDNDVIGQVSTNKDPFLRNNCKGIQLYLLLWES